MLPESCDGGAVLLDNCTALKFKALKRTTAQIIELLILTPRARSRHVAHRHLVRTRRLHNMMSLAPLGLTGGRLSRNGQIADSPIPTLQSGELDGACAEGMS